MLNKDLSAQTEEISDYIMKNLYHHIFSLVSHSVTEYNLQVKIEKMFELTTDDYGIPEDCKQPEMQFAWKASIRELQRIPEALTPRQKLQHVGKSIEIIQHSF